MGFELDVNSEAAFVRQLAEGMHEGGVEIAAEIAIRAPHERDRSRKRTVTRYNRTIHATTYLRNEVIGGQTLRNRQRLAPAEIQTVVYTSSPLGHLLERGTQEHDVSRKDAVLDVRAKGNRRMIIHPGSRPFPHFAPGALAGVGKFAAAIEKRVK